MSGCALRRRGQLAARRQDSRTTNRVATDGRLPFFKVGDFTHRWERTRTPQLQRLGVRSRSPPDRGLFLFHAEVYFCRRSALPCSVMRAGSRTQPAVFDNNVLGVVPNGIADEVPALLALDYRSEAKFADLVTIPVFTI